MLNLLKPRLFGLVIGFVFFTGVVRGQVIAFTMAGGNVGGNNNSYTITNSSTAGGSSSSLQSFSIPVSGYIADTASISKANWSVSVTTVSDTSTITFTSNASLANAQLGTNFTVSFQSTVLTYQSQQVTYLTQQGANYFANTSLPTSAVPEPSTYAAIFGLTVLGFAVHRKRKNSV